ncbi:8-oxo-dGTP diphosphatase MutT [Lacimicrobium sp. SS2-24]|uniref:8-oxo-dGTP diphosphatase MutT n=1 Tax=Lacimicrobium sp. SS2-24 TaxID=2005569 RepID=UPI000B4B7524|nr:8-oxo-dGTP diphosphatase MutT [Lacimicrobium sp. SS2-24]
MTVKHISVAVGVILKAQSTFITLRKADQHQGGKWEFPGGKCEPGEPAQQALRRELQEETGIRVTDAEPFMTIRHDYGDKVVELEVFLVRDYQGEPHGREGQTGRWVPLSVLTDYEFPQANVAIIEKLQRDELNDSP